MTIRSMIVALLPLFAVVAAQQASADEKLIFKSTSFKHLGEALSGVPGEPVDIKADLRFPPATENRVPAVVVLHTIGGYRESNEGWHSEQFRKAGFATLTYESISVRGINDAPTRGAAPLWGSLVADGFNALKALAAHPRIDASRIAVTGYSMGGEATRLLAFERLRRVFVQDDLRFAAHVAVYPCHVWGVPAAPGAFTGAPVLEQLGGADDCGPFAKAERYYDYLNTMGHPAPVRIVVYPGAPHSWTDPWFATERFYPNHASPSKCPLLLIGQGGNLAFDGGKVRSLDGGELGACLRQSRGYTQGFQPLTRDKSTADAIAFFRQAFGR